MFNKRFAGPVLILIFCHSLSFAQNFSGNPAELKWQQINSPKSRVIFPVGLDSQANRISRIMQLLDTATAPTIGGKQRKWNIVLQNQTTNSNAYVRMAPLISEFYMTPDQNNFTEGSIRWDDNLVIHENRHMQQFSNFNKGLTKIFSFLLGQEGQLLANGLVIPNYFFEGDAVWQETLVSNQGRGRFPYFFNGMKSLWLAQKNYSWMKLRSGSFKHFTPDHYPLGYMMVAYGNELYGENFWKNVTTNAVRFKGIFYPFNKGVSKYSGKSYRQFRTEALRFFKERSFADSNNSATKNNYITAVQKNNVVDYLFPAYISDDSILVSKRSYRKISTFYLLVKGKEKKVRLKNTVLDEYYSYSSGKIVYASYQSDPRWANRDYSVLQVVDIKTGKQKQLTHRTKYFSPAINSSATEILAVQVCPDGTNNLHRLNVATGKLQQVLPNPDNYFFTQTKYLTDSTAVAIVRNPAGRNAMVLVDLTNGSTDIIIPFSVTVMGYPFVKNGLVYFNAMDGYSDKVFSVNLATRQIVRLTQNSNGIYYPVVNSRDEILTSAFTADGYRLLNTEVDLKAEKEISFTSFPVPPNLYTSSALQKGAAGALYTLNENPQKIEKYRKTFQLFNFHSRRMIVSEPEYGYSFFSDNILFNFSNDISYTYNRNEKSHTFGLNARYGGWYPILSLGAEAGLDRRVQVIEGPAIRTVNFNSAKLNAGVALPLSFVGGRTNKFLNIGAGYNAEQLYYQGIGKNIFSNQPLHYLNSFLQVSNISRQARQHVNPRWAQTLAATYRQAFNFNKNKKFVANSNFYFPGLFSNHSLLLQGSFQKRDTVSDVFSNTFVYARGYGALSTRMMYKFGINYQLPVMYPDIGFGNIIFFQRIRANAFYDHGSARARINGRLTDINSRSAGGELFFDTRLWNALPVSFAVRFSHLLDTDLLKTGVANKWEFLLFNFIPR